MFFVVKSFSNRFGYSTDAVITLNFQSQKTAFAVQLCLVVSMILAFPLQFLPVRTITESYFFDPDEESYWMRTFWKISIVILIGSAGSMIPHFALVYGFVGGFAGCLIAFIFPLVIYIALEKPKGKLHIFLLFCSFLILFVSTASSGKDLMQKMMYNR